MGSVMTIGIAGGTGSGKTTITRRLLQKFSSNVSVIYHDNYYKAHNDLNYEQRSLLNYDCPDAFDTELMLRDLKRLRAGEAIRCPVYDYTIHNRSDKTVLVKPSPVVIVAVSYTHLDVYKRQIPGKRLVMPSISIMYSGCAATAPPPFLRLSLIHI